MIVSRQSYPEDLNEQEVIDALPEMVCKMEHDATGHYARPDVLELTVNEK